jgi:hypothetical protein
MSTPDLLKTASMLTIVGGRVVRKAAGGEIGPGLRFKPEAEALTAHQLHQQRPVFLICSHAIL